MLVFRIANRERGSLPAKTARKIILHLAKTVIKYYTQTKFCIFVLFILILYNAFHQALPSSAREKKD